jgi:hypothetical protein
MMSNPRHALKALGLCLLAALGLMAVSAAGAQADGHVYVNGVLLEKHIDWTAEIEKHSILLSTVGKTNTPIEILCELLTVDDGLILAGEVTGILLFSMCETYLNKVLSGACKPAEPIEAKIKGLPILHNGHNYLLLEPLEAGKPFTTISLGAECSIGEKFEVTGSIVLKDCNTLKDLAVEQEVHLVEEALRSLFPSDGLNFGVKSATIDGSANITLLGEHAKLPWKALV